MSLNDAMYRAFKLYRKETEERNCQSLRKTLRKSDSKMESFKVTKYLCTIEEDWIKAIEDGLVFVDKAIGEERQFIRVNGETVPIEKAKKISRDSVVHLAKHSQLISRLPDNPEDTLVPDEIYIVEKLSDYAVYENRFLYLLLYQLQEFIAMRMDKIKRLRSTYICDYAISRKIQNKVSLLEFKDEYHEEKYDNPYPIFDERCNGLVKRIEDIALWVNSLLKTQLMIDVSKAPMVKPPITKTNVLKMNNNFKNALALYDYICSYKGDGYKAEEVIKDFIPLKDNDLDEMMEVIMLQSHLTYKMGNEIEELLEIEFEREEERLRQEEQKKLIERIARLKKKVVESGQSMEEYMLALEERNKALEHDSLELIEKKKEIEALNLHIEELNTEILELHRQISDLENVILEKDKHIAYLNQKYIDDMNALKLEHQHEIAKLRALHEDEIVELCRKHDLELEAQKESFEKKMLELEAEYNDMLQKETERLAIEYQDIITSHVQTASSLKEEIQALQSSMDSLKEENHNKIEKITLELEQSILDRNKRVDEYETKLKDMESMYTFELSTTKNKCANDLKEVSDKLDAVTREKHMVNAEYNALRIEHGLLEVSDDYTTKDRFDELEREFEAFNAFFKAEWKRTKKSIRKQLLWTKEEKKEIASKKNEKEEKDNQE